MLRDPLIMNRIPPFASFDLDPSGHGTTERRSHPGPRILYVSPFWPVVPKSASEVRALQIGRALQEIGRVQVALVNEEQHFDSQVAAALQHDPPAHFQSFRVRPCPRKHASEKLNWLLNPRVRYPHGVQVDDTGAERLWRLASESDMVWFFKLRTANLFPQWAWPRSVVDIDDVPSTFEASALTVAVTVQERLATYARLWSWRRREALMGDRFAVAAVCSEQDKRHLQELGVNTSIHVIPNGFPQPTTAPARRPASPNRLGFIGVFDHEPNVSGIRWFVEHCWPAIKRQLPDLRLRLVGRLSDGPLSPVGPDIDALGWVDDPSDEIATWSAMIVPVRIGAGTRGKIAHAFSQKCPVVSTPLGAYGYDARDGVDMFLAESADAFVDACVCSVQRPAMAAAVAERAWQRFLERWTWSGRLPTTV
jgi:glycosyltransferase involved in cell wall biosynthesis